MFFLKILLITLFKHWGVYVFHQLYLLLRLTKRVNVLFGSFGVIHGRLKGYCG